MCQIALLLSSSAGLEAHPGTKWPGCETDQTPQYAGVKSVVVPLLPRMSLWRVKVQLHLYKL